MEDNPLAAKIKQHYDTFIQCMRDEEMMMMQLYKKDIITTAELSKIRVSDSTRKNKCILDILLSKNVAQLHKFGEILRSRDFAGDGHKQLYRLIKDDMRNTRKRVREMDEQGTSKRQKASVLHGYPYDVSDVGDSRKGSKYWRFKLHTERGYFQVVSDGLLLDKQGTVRKCEHEGKGLSVIEYSCSKFKDGDIFLEKNSKLTPMKINLEFNFTRKIFPLSEARDLHFGSIVDVEVKVLNVEEPVTGATVWRQELRVADASHHMWLKVKFEHIKMLKKEKSYLITKCRVGILHDLKFLHTIEETKIRKSQNHIEPLTLNPNEEKVSLENRVTEIYGSIKSCNMKSITTYEGCPTCKGKTTISENITGYKCGNCGETGLARYMEKIQIASGKLVENGTQKLRHITLFSTEYPDQNCLKTVLEANKDGLNQDVEDMDEFDISDHLYSEKIWKMRVTPKGNVVSVEGI